MCNPASPSPSLATPCSIHCNSTQFQLSLSLALSRSLSLYLSKYQCAHAKRFYNSQSLPSSCSPTTIPLSTRILLPVLLSTPTFSSLLSSHLIGALKTLWGEQACQGKGTRRHVQESQRLCHFLLAHHLTLGGSGRNLGFFQRCCRHLDLCFL